MSLHSTIFCNSCQNRSFRRFCCKTSTLPSLMSFHCMIFCSFCQNPFIRHFHWGLWTPLMHYAMIALSNFFVIFVKINEHLHHFCQFCWSIWSLSCLMPWRSAVFLNFLSKLFFLYFLWGLWTLSHNMPLHSTIFVTFSSKSLFLSVSLTTCDYL